MARVAIVTGGTRGIGEAISIALKDMGMKVAANYAGNDERAREFTERTGIPAFKWDVADFEACQEGVRKVEAELGPVDVLVNNAGITRDTTMKRMDHQKWQEVIDTNLGGCFNMAKAVFEGMPGAATAGSSTSARSTARPANTARSIMPPPSRASTASPRRWRRKARATASRSTRSRPAISTPTWSPRCPRKCSARSSRKIPVDRLGKAERDRARRRLPGRRECRLRHRVDAVDQRRAAHVLMDARVRTATETVGAHRRPSDLDQPRADVLARARSGGARRRACRSTRSSRRSTSSGWTPSGRPT